tara:strand:+ start:258 stop:770 length:513 start_codon:yes stop_codon:yes gene_type:complete
MSIKVTGGKKFTRTINFYKKEKNWVSILDKAAKNVANDIRDDAETKLYNRWKKTTGKTGKSIKPRVYKKGNNVYLSLSSDHPAMNFLEYGGEVKKIPAYTADKNSRLFPYVENWHSAAMYDKEDKAMKMAGAIHANQPFKQGTFHMTNALREGLPALEGEVIRVAKSIPK